jgi:hypothetical protein
MNDPAVQADTAAQILGADHGRFEIPFACVADGLAGGTLQLPRLAGARRGHRQPHAVACSSCHVP